MTHKIKERPDILESKTTCIKTGLGKLYITITYHEGQPFEIFATIGKSGKEVMAMTEAIGRMVSLWLRSGGDIDAVIKQLKDIAGDHPEPTGKVVIKSIPDGIAYVLEKYGVYKDVPEISAEEIKDKDDIPA